MRRTVISAAVLVTFVAAAPPALAQRFSLEVMGGTAYNVPTPLTVRQSGFPDVRITAHYDTKPFGPFAPYYSWRANFWKGTGAWELHHVHHRLFLANTTDEIQSFSIHYGYNYFLAGRAWRHENFVLHASGGVVVTSPASTIRGRSLNTQAPGVFDIGYRVSGVGGEVAVTKSWPLSSRVYVLADGALLAGTVSVPVVDGSARAPNIGFHGRLGVGFNLW